MIQFSDQILREIVHCTESYRNKFESRIFGDYFEEVEKLISEIVTETAVDLSVGSDFEDSEDFSTTESEELCYSYEWHSTDDEYQGQDAQRSERSSSEDLWIDIYYLFIYKLITIVDLFPIRVLKFNVVHY